LGWIGSILTLLVVIAASVAFAADASDHDGPRAQEDARPVQRDFDFKQILGTREFSSRLIVRPLQRDALLRRGLTAEQAAARIAEAQREIARYDIHRYVPQTDEYIITIPARRAGRAERRVARRLMATGNFQYVEPDWIVYPVVSPDDPLLPQQWHHQLDRMQSFDGWNIHTGDPAVSIGICDTGIRTTHEDLQSNRLEGYNAVNRLWEAQGGQIGPVHPHGTMTTGTAAANGNNGFGVVGVGWNLSHRMLRVTNRWDGRAYLSDLQHCARTSIENGDRVVSVSYSGVTSISNLTTATYIKSIGGLLVWAAGNDARNLTYFGERDADDIIVAGATDANDARAWFSAYGGFVDLFAPGVNVLTTGANHDADYAFVSGTSFAAPLTAGLIALIWSADPTLTPGEVENILKQGADDLGAPGVDGVFGYGRINVFGSLSLIGGENPPVAKFSGLPTSGVSPLTVHFTDQSARATSWEWDFGDGTTSTLQHPSHTYTTTGFYTVSLTVTNAYGSDTLDLVNYIAVDLIPPIADFNGSPNSGEAPLTVHFTDLSSGGSPTSWLWGFGDGSTSTAQHPTHTYTSAGIYTVSLTATNDYGSDFLLRPNYIEVSPGPPVQANFVGSPTAGPAPLTVAFTDLSSGSPTSWSWDFGDDGTSTAQHPSHTYTKPGAFKVTLTVANAEGSDTLIREEYITVPEGGGGNPPVANFSGSPTAGTAPLTVHFTDLSSGGTPTIWEWTFGDGGTSTVQHPRHIYATPGVYTVTLTAGNADGANTRVRTNYITVNGGNVTPPVANFSGSPTAGLAPLTVAFTDLSTGSPTSWSWDFGDGSTSTAQHPSHTYATPGVYTVTLTAGNAGGANTRVRPNYITVNGGGGGNPPVANFSGSPTAGLAPLTVAFTDLSTGSPTSWSWDFGDDGTSTAQHPSHTYTKPGVFKVILTVTNANGSDTLKREDYITVPEK
jgi:PKD repeat protein